MSKCRAKTVGTGEEVKGYHFKNKDKHYIILDDAEIGDYGVEGEMLYGFLEVDPETIAMFTTILDKNDVEIYGSFLINGTMTSGGDRVRGIIDGEEHEWDIVWETDDMLGWSIDNTNMPCEVIGRSKGK